ncbi:MAG: hypothetical protein RL708_1746 [Bacteroidota bacterium]
MFCIALYWQIIHKDNLNQAWHAFINDIESANSKIIILVLLLMVVNWSIESLKWRLLIKKMQPISFFEALQGVLSGVAVGTFTPNRIGEFGGRILFLKEHQKVRGVVVTLIGSFGQIMVTLTTGLAASYIFILKYLDIRIIKENESILLKATLLTSICLLIGLFLIVYFNLNLIDKLIARIPYLRKLRKYIAIVSTFGYIDLLKLLLLSYLRFAVFAFQFYLLIKIFNVPVSFLPSIIMICMIFFTQTIIPSFTITELGVRVKVSTFFFGYLVATSTTFGVEYATSVLWIINLIIPAIVGMIFLLRKRINT